MFCPHVPFLHVLNIQFQEHKEWWDALVYLPACVLTRPKTFSAKSSSDFWHNICEKRCCRAVIFTVFSFLLVNDRPHVDKSVPLGPWVTGVVSSDDGLSLLLSSVILSCLLCWVYFYTLAACYRTRWYLLSQCSRNSRNLHYVDFSSPLSTRHLPFILLDR